MDTRLKNLSHSSSCLLHSCPRKYQLTKLWPDLEREESIDTIYGKMFHVGIQNFVCGVPINESLLIAALEWKTDLYEFKKEKSFFHCWNAIEQFAYLYPETQLANYKVLEYNGKPAMELSFRIELPNGFYYRGYVDLVLQNLYDDSILVVDLKTSGAKYTSPAKYQNSAQNIGYSLVLETILPGMQSFNVMYYEYLTSINKYVAHDFLVDPLDRAIWIRDLLMECDVMQFYDNNEDWPKHGESCISYNRPCNFLDNCTTPLSMLIGTDVEERDGKEIDREQNYDIEVNLLSLIEAQENLL